MKHLPQALCATLICATLSPAQARVLTSGELLRICSDQKASCLNYIEGVVDTLNNLTRWGYLKSDLVCIPDQVDDEQLVSIVTKYLRDNPDLTSSAASERVIDILSWTFPCQENEDYQQRQ